MIARRGIHFWFTAILGLLLIPAGIHTHLLILPELSTFRYMMEWGIEGVLWTVVLYQLGIKGSWSWLRRDTKRFIPAGMLVAILLFIFGLKIGGIAASVGIVLTEFIFRKGDWRRLASVLLPWLYLTAGIEMSLDYSAVIVSMRPCTEFDSALKMLDAHLFFGASVVDLSRASSAFYMPAELFYYLVFGAMLSGIILLCMDGDQRSAFELAGAMLTTFYISLAIFYFLPAQGPFIAGGLPSNVLTATLERASLSNATMLFHHTAWINAPRSYYVSFPSDHVAQPLIAAWYLRRWRIISAIVLGFCILLIPSILILQWHYIVDIIAGILVAIVSVLVVSAGSRKAARLSSPA